MSNPVSVDLGMVRANAERQKADSEMIIALCDSLFRVESERQRLAAPPIENQFEKKKA